MKERWRVIVEIAECVRSKSGSLVSLSNLSRLFFDFSGTRDEAWIHIPHMGSNWGDGREVKGVEIRPLNL